MSEATPRVNATILEKFSNQTVRILGKVVQLRGDSAVIDAGGQINVLLGRDSHLQTDHVVEIVGKVMNDLSVKVLLSTDWGTKVDLKAAEAVVDATHRFPRLFYAQSD